MKYSLYGNLSATEAKIILTPHQGEAKRLLEVEQIEDDRQSVLDISEAFNATVVMKGANTLVVEKDRGYRNKTGNPGMATGNSGDVLTGTVAAFRFARENFTSMPPKQQHIALPI